MANTVKTTNRTIEVSAIDEDYMMGQLINVYSIVFIPGASGDSVDIIENSQYAIDPVKVRLISSNGEPRAWTFKQRLQLGFVFSDGTFNTGAKVVFNIGEAR